MAIVVGHEPVGAAYNLATQAGQAQAMQREQEQRDRIQLQGMQEQMRMREMAFQEKAQAAARQEEMQFQAMMVQAKRQIDLQTEAAQYAQDKQKLNAALSMINESSHSESEKQDFKIQAMAKYAGVGGGLTSASFANTDLENQLTKGAYRTMQMTEIQNAVLNKQMSPEEATRMSVAMGLGNMEFQTGDDIANAPHKKVQDKMDDISDSMSKLKLHEDKKGRLYDAQMYKVPEDSPAAKTYRALQVQQDKVAAEMAKIQQGGGGGGSVPRRDPNYRGGGDWNWKDEKKGASNLPKEMIDSSGKEYTIRTFFDEVVMNDKSRKLMESWNLYGPKETFDTYKQLVGSK